MGQNLYKLGKRKCSACKGIFYLTTENFYKNKSQTGGFSYECKSCSHNYNKRIRIELITNADFKCQKCGIYNKNFSFFDIDHIKPILRKRNSRGQRNNFYKETDIPNLIVYCPNCHRLKTLQNNEFNH